ncbi:MAG: gliding motility-associated C-terminal domain-containing protein [Bacteroidetes bacterium CHB5]|nr:gliding motility-associated C-terminal domain-containing protein [Bacteroidetes bacterium CHB5]
MVSRAIRVLVGVVFLSLPVSVWATHIRAGQITLKRVDCAALTFDVTIHMYTDTGSPIRFGDGELRFGDGSPVHITPERPNTFPSDLNLPQDVGFVAYTVKHTFPGPGSYIISYLEANRNEGVLNIANSVNTTFYIETQIIIDPFLGCSNTPVLLVPPIDKACTSVAFFHNPGAYDPDGDSLSYEFTIPKKDKGSNVIGYLDPNTKTFYDRIGLNYGTANEAGTGSPTFSINPITGTITWDAPGAPGEYNIAFKIIEWRKINGTWINQGYVIRDMQIIVEDCMNQRPELEVPSDFCVVAGDTVTFDVFGTDPDFDSVKIEAFSQIFSINPSPATFTPAPVEFQYTAPGIKASQTLTWNTTCDHIKDQPYQVNFKITDKGSPALVQFKTVNIRVVGPAPVWEPPVLDLATRSAQLSWEDYVCGANAVSMQIWRRVDSSTFIPDCETGMPDFLGFSLIGTVPIGTTTFNDNNGGNGLVSGAKYCYRLVAVFPQPGGGESLVSQEVCLPPILADLPAITNVSVEVTSRTNGEILVRWVRPFQADQGQFPPPYTYELHRAEGFSGEINLTPAFPGRRADTVFTDTQLNTKDLIYNYRVIAYDNNNVKVGESAPASTVRLETASKFQRIDLTWNADVPWTNNSQSFPLHEIYRGPENATEAQMVLIDVVDVTQYAFNYADSGQYNNQPLQETQEYCYRVRTRGTYGNPLIDAPLENFSQIICATPNDLVPPCKPQFTMTGVDCQEFIETSSCGANLYSNTLSWQRPADLACRDDIRNYKVLMASRLTEAFTEIAIVSDTFFVHSNLPSFAACYKIIAVDRAGNESEASEVFCFDNCPYYELPNVFTPNDDQCNDLFSAFSDRIGDVIGEDGVGPCGQDLADLRKRCARFVLKVDFKVYNRWGKEVYRYTSGGERSIYIDWDGRDKDGRELSTGFYFYSAEVTFDVIDPARQNKSLKGWIHLVR